ncbi:MAG: energy-coupling factor transporter transmembrane protein EcfT [Chloroflexi bacterium]|nr:energy-coupling factor transporter transmembrane protein EcfT [Chloroflexota bacterium]
MLVTWKYKPRNTLIQRLDPRSRLIFYACFLVSVFMFWDLRILLFFLAVALLAVLAAQLSWRDTRRTWLFIGAFILIYALLTLLTGRGGFELYKTERVIATLRAPFTIFNWQPTLTISIEQIFFALSQFARVFSIASMTILIPYTIDPAQYGITFRRLGLPDKLAFAMDLTMRFVPSLGRDFAMTMDAQKARGYELERREGGLIGQVRRLAPLLVPVVIHSIVSGEEITDAMDLRAFGTQPRTWLRELVYQRRDYILIIAGVLMLATAIIGSTLGLGRFWAP